MPEQGFEHFKEYSVAEFFKKNRHMLGFSGKIRSLTTIIHEYVTNSLDACEEAGILPRIKVDIKQVGEDRYRVRVEDNGPGLPKSLIGKALGQMLAGTKFHRYIQQRGQQGIGAAGCTMFALLTTGKPIHVISGHGGITVSCDVSIDLKSNKPIVKNIVERESSFHGLIIEGEFGEVKYDRGPYSPLEYLRRTALANPHATILFTDPNGQRYFFPRSTEEIPPRPKEVKPHPLGLNAFDLLEFARHSKAKKLETFLTSELSRVSKAKVEELKKLLPELDFSKPPQALEWKESEALVKAFRKIKWIAPPLDSVIPIGKERIEKSIRNILKPEFLAVVQRPPKIYRGGIPFLVEVGIGYGTLSKDINIKGTVMRFANRTPLLFDASACAITQVVKGIDWKRYNIQKFEEEPVVVFVNVSSVHVPYVSAGKQAISPEAEVVAEIKNAVQEAARNIMHHIRKKIKAREAEKKKKAFLRYVKQLSRDLAELSKEANAEELEVLLLRLVESRFSKVLPVHNNGEGAEDEKAEEVKAHGQ